MPASEVFKKAKEGRLHSGGPNGPKVKPGSKQAVAIYLSEKRNEEETGSADRPARLRPKRGKR